jgi:hypothetical protein
LKFVVGGRTLGDFCLIVKEETAGFVDFFGETLVVWQKLIVFLGFPTPMLASKRKIPHAFLRIRITPNVSHFTQNFRNELGACADDVWVADLWHLLHRECRTSFAIELKTT